ncbi:MAG: hypothetical protein AAF564_26305, partial [Bacteroidota bacterium]
FVYIIGIEGCGHHGFMPVVENLVGASLSDPTHMQSRWQAIRKAFNNIWLHPNPFVKRWGKSQLKRLLKRIAKQDGGQDQTFYILEDNSFPSGDIRTVGAGWDLQELIALVEPFADVHLISLNRHPIAATFSHKDWDGGFRGHAQVLADHMDYLTTCMTAIGGENFKTISYEAMTTHSQEVVEGLVNYLELPYGNTQHAFKDFRASKKNWRVSLAPEEKAWAEAFFNADKMKGWDVLHGANNSLIGTEIKEWATV